MPIKRYYCDYAWLPGGWTRQVARMDSTRRIGRYVLPGLPNLHSHAFQRAMAGLA